MKTLTIHRKLEELEDIEISINQGSVRKYTLMKEDCVVLRFTLNENIPLRIGDYVDLTEYLPEDEHDDYTTKWFVIDEDYFPTYDKNTGGWKYDLQINAFYYMWKNKIFVYDGKRSSAEAAVSLTDKIDKHVGMIVDNLAEAGMKYLGGFEFHCEYDKALSGKGLKNIVYNGISILDAIKEIANTFECEWWVDRTAVHFGYRKNEDAEIPLEMNKQIDSASTSRANGTYATRLYAFGGTTNIPEKYGDALEFTVDKVDGDSVYDTKKPVYSNLFLNRNDAPILSTGISVPAQDGDAISDTYVNERVLSLGTFNFKAQNYKVSVESFVPHIIITKIATHGSVNDYFNINFRCSLRLKKGDKIVDISQIDNKAIGGKLSSLMNDSYNLKILDSRGGFFGEGGTFRDDFFKNESISLYRTGYQGCLLQTQIGYEHTKLSPFWATSAGSLVKNETEARSLTPRQEHRHNEFYSMYVSGLTKNVAIWRGFYKEPSTVVAKGTTSDKYFEIWDAKNFSDFFDIPEGGDYELQLYIKETGTTNVVKYDNDRTPLLVFTADVPQFNISFQRTAQSVDTKIQYKQDGKWIDADVTLNPDFLDDSNIGSSKIKFKGDNPLKIGNTFRFKEIIRSRVAQNYGEYFTSYSTNNLKSGVVQRNLMLPEGVKYVDANENINDGNAVELIVKYDWIYPSTICTVKRAPDPDNGNYYVWIDVANYSQEMRAKDSTLKAKFQSGSSSGLTYELEYIEKNSDGSQSKFRLVPNNDWGDEIPNNVVAPKVGDTLILEGVNIEFFDSNAVKDAEERLKTQAENDIKEFSKANVVIDITLRPDYAYNTKLQLGQLVNIKNAIEKEYHSRIIGFEEKLDYHYDHPKYAIGDANYYSVIGNIDSKVTEIQKESAALNGINGGNRIKIISALDNSTRPSDANVHSAKRVERCFLRKDIDDVVEGNPTFEKNITVKGTAEIDTLVVSKDSKVIGNSEVAGNSSVAGSQTIEKDSRTRGDHSVEGTLRIADGGDDESAIVVGNYVGEGDIVQGARISKKGVATFAAIKTPSLQVYELTYNRKTAVQGEFIFSDGDTVENVLYIDLDGNEHTPQQVSYEEYFPYQVNEDGSYILDSDGRKVPNFKCIKLLLKTPYEGYITTFKEYDILYSNINNIGASGQSATTGKCFMRVLTADEVNEMGIVPSEEKNILYVTLYDDNDVPSGVNMLPAPWMDITRHGNTTNTNRQDVFIISSEERRLAQLVGVNSPIISYDTMYGIVLGELPDVLYEYVRNAGYNYLDENKPYLYAQGAIIEDLILIDYKGKVIKNQRFRGIWDKDVAESDDNKYRVTETTYDTVSHNGSLWQCNADGTKEEPHAGSNAWILIVAKGEDGTSIKVTDSYDDILWFEADWLDVNGWKAPEDPSDCYIVGTDLYVWVPDSKEWKNVGQFKGDKGDKGDTGEAGKDGLSPQENLLDNTSQFDANWTLYDVATVEDGVDGHKAISFVKRGTYDVAKQPINGKIIGGEWYSISFIGKGGSRIVGLVSENIIDTTEKQYQDGNERTSLSISLSSDWEYHTYTFKTVAEIPDESYVEIKASGASRTYMCKIKLERGQSATSWMESIDDRRGSDGLNPFTNILDGTRFSNLNAWTSSMGEAKNSSYVNLLSEETMSDVLIQSITGRLRPDTWYTLSFKMRGWSEYYEYPISTLIVDSRDWGKNNHVADANTPFIIDGVERPINATGDYVTPDLCSVVWKTTYRSKDDYDESDKAWVKHTLTFKTLSEKLMATDYSFYVRQWAGDSNSSYIELCEVKLEEGKVDTPWSSSENDLIGRGIKSIAYEYLVTTTGIQPELSDSGWTDKRPNVQAGEYLWTKTITDYTDGTRNDEVNVTVSRVSADGKSVTTTDTDYAESTSGTDIPDDEDWGDTIPSVAEGNFLWTRITFSDGNKAYSVSKDGKSLTITSIAYSTEFTEEQPDDDTFDLEVPPSGTKGGYVWSLTIYSDETKDYSKSYVPLDGEDVIFADLSNEIDSIPLDDDGNTRTDEELTTTVSIYKGTETSTITKLLVNNKDVDSTIGEWLNIHIAKSTDGSPTGEIKFNVIKGKLATERVSIPISVAANNVTRNLTFTIVGVKGLTIYRLSVDASQIVKLKNGTTFPSSLSVKRYKITGDERVEITGNDDPVTYIVDDVNKGAWTGSYDLGTVKNYIQFTFHEEVETLYVVRDGEDAGSTYTLLATPDTIYVNKKGEVSSETISLSVVETTPYGSYTITDINEVSAKELKIKYKISGNTKIKDVTSLALNLSDLFEDGEYKPIDFALYHDGKIVFSKTVGFSREGKDGETPITLHSSPSTVNILRSAQDKEYLGEKEHKFEVFARDSYGVKTTTDYTIEASNDGKGFYTATDTTENGKHYVTVKFNKDIIDGQPDSVSVSFTSKDGEDWGTLLVPISISERGIAGERGGEGAMLLPYGNWQANVFYKLQMKGDSVFGRPCVYYREKGASKGTLFVLNKSMDDNLYDEEEGIKYPVDSNGNKITTSNEEYWTRETYTQFIFAEALMAPYAQLGTDKGAVFFDRYLFSQYGIDSKGNFDTYSSHVDDMWEDDGSLSGTFTPSLFINMYAGETKTNKLAETFQEYRYFDGDELFANEIRFNETYCVKFEPRISMDGTATPRLLSMPLATSITYNGNVLVGAQHDTELDGVRSVILSKANRAWSRKMRGTFEEITGVDGFTSISELSSASLLLCAEPRLFNPYAWRFDGTSLRNVALDSNEYDMGRFVINGVFTDFIMVEPAQQVILRSCYSDGTLFWYVENAEDFEEVPFEVLYGGSENKTESITVFDESNGELISFEEYNPNVGCDSYGEVYGLNRKTFATKSIARFYKEKMKGSGLAMTVYVSTVGQSGAVSGEEKWNWEQDIDGVTIS